LRNGTGRGAALDGFAAGKTGTNQPNYRDAWFIGLNDSLVVGVWIGNDDHTPMKRVTGVLCPPQSGSASGPPCPERSRPLRKQAAHGGGLIEIARPRDPPHQPAADPSPNAGISLRQAPGSQAAGTPRCDYEACSRTYPPRPISPPVKSRQRIASIRQPPIVLRLPRQRPVASR
jgi:penicillin-binding protein 1A